MMIVKLSAFFIAAVSAESLFKTCRRLKAEGTCNANENCLWKKGLCKPFGGDKDGEAICASYTGKRTDKAEGRIKCAENELCFVNKKGQCRPASIKSWPVDCTAFSIHECEHPTAGDEGCHIVDGKCIAECRWLTIDRKNCKLFKGCVMGKPMGEVEAGAVCHYVEPETTVCETMPREQCRNMKNMGKLTLKMQCWYNSDTDSCHSITDCASFPKKNWCHKMSKGAGAPEYAVSLCYWHETDGCLPVPEDITPGERHFRIVEWSAYAVEDYGKAYRFNNGSNGWSDREYRYREVPKYIKKGVFFVTPKKIPAGKGLNVKYAPADSEGWCYVLMPREPKGGKGTNALGWDDGDAMETFGFELVHNPANGKAGEVGFHYDRIFEGKIKASFYRRIYRKRLSGGEVTFGSPAGGLKTTESISVTFVFMLDDMSLIVEGLV